VKPETIPAYLLAEVSSWTW